MEKIKILPIHYIPIKMMMSASFQTNKNNDIIITLAEVENITLTRGSNDFINKSNISKKEDI